MSKPATIDASTATFDAPDDFPPTKENWIDHKLAWGCLNEPLQHYPGSSLGSSTS